MQLKIIGNFLGYCLEPTQRVPGGYKGSVKGVSPLKGFNTSVLVLASDAQVKLERDQAEAAWHKRILWKIAKLTCYFGMSAALIGDILYAWNWLVWKAILAGQLLWLVIFYRHGTGQFEKKENLEKSCPASKLHHTCSCTQDNSLQYWHKVIGKISFPKNCKPCSKQLPEPVREPQWRLRNGLSFSWSTSKPFHKREK